MYQSVLILMNAVNQVNVMKVSRNSKYSYKVFSSETVVFDNHGKVVIKCPTEDEAVEYIRRLEDDHNGRKQKS